MERFQAFIGRTLERARLDNQEALGRAGLEPRYLPETFEEFDEVDFLAPLEPEGPLDGRNRMVLSVAIERGKVQRILLGWVAPGDPEDTMRRLDEETLGRALEMNGDRVVAFFEEVLG